uniref:Uncharacterized protein n=1 Tax=Cannabis sativa TaxID=3483 RepID=A0A803PVD8_CANSA
MRLVRSGRRSMMQRGRLELVELAWSSLDESSEPPRSRDLELEQGFTVWKLLDCRCEQEDLEGTTCICNLKEEREFEAFEASREGPSRLLVS